MVIRIIDRYPAKNLLLIKNATLQTYDIMIAKPNLPGRFPKPLYKNFTLLQHFLTEEEARPVFENLKKS